VLEAHRHDRRARAIRTMMNFVPQVDRLENGD
jgi:hypothetical protein